MVSELVEAIGEVALRVKNMEAMVDFYVEKLGFNIRRRFGNDVAAIQLAPSIAGQIQTLTLFDQSLPGNFHRHEWGGLDCDCSPLHHFAMTIRKENYDILHAMLTEKRIPFDTANHRWTGWRGTYVKDPENNIVEFVCYDEDFDEGKQGIYDFSKLHGSPSHKPFE